MCGKPKISRYSSHAETGLPDDLDRSKNLPQMLIWCRDCTKGTEDIQAPYLCPQCGSSSPPALIWLLGPSGLASLQGQAGYAVREVMQPLCVTARLLTSGGARLHQAARTPAPSYHSRGSRKPKSWVLVSVGREGRRGG